MFKRQRTGSVVCASCGSLVGVNDEQCYTCGRRNPGLWGFGPMLRRLGSDFGFITLVVYGCSALYVVSLLLTLRDGQSIMGSGLLSILRPGELATLRLGISGAVPVFEGMWWTVLSAGWLHGSVLHIIVNMMAVRQIGPAAADIYGGARVVIIYTLASACGFLLSSVAGHVMPRLPIIGGAHFTLGASGAIFGLVGALMYYSRRTGSSLMTSQLSGYVVSMAVFGVLLPGIDNYAHAGGFAGGYLVGMWLDPLKPERVDHMVGALVCLLATVAAIVTSFVWVTHRLQ